MARASRPASGDTDEWVSRYRDIRPALMRCTDKLKALLGDLLAAQSIDFHVLEARTKKVDSFEDKIKRPERKYTDPLRQVTDLVGLRIITYYDDDVDRACETIRREFKVDEKNSVDRRRTSPDQFGYSSVHLVVSLSPRRARLPEWKDVGGLQAEIQVRTVLQHAWAAISHALQYKQEAGIPLPLRRKLSRLAGLLELADEQFRELRDQQSALSEDVRERIEARELGVSVDTTSLSEYIQRSPEVASLFNVALEAGFMAVTGGEPGPEIEIKVDTIGNLAATCKHLQIDTLLALERVLVSAHEWSHRYFQELKARSSGTWAISPAFAVQLVVIASLHNLVTLEHLEGWRFGRDIAGTCSPCCAAGSRW